MDQNQSIKYSDEEILRDFMPKDVVLHDLYLDYLRRYLNDLNPKHMRSDH